MSKRMYAVLRDCCRSGQCIKCWPFPRDPSQYLSRRRVVVCQGHDLSLVKAKEVACGWKDFNARVVSNPHGLSCEETQRRQNVERDEIERGKVAGSQAPPYFENPDFERFHRD